MKHVSGMKHVKECETCNTSHDIMMSWSRPKISETYLIMVSNMDSVKMRS